MWSIADFRATTRIWPKFCCHKSSRKSHCRTSRALLFGLARMTLLCRETLKTIKMCRWSSTERTLRTLSRILRWESQAVIRALIGWLMPDLLQIWSVDRLIDWLIDCLNRWFIDWLTDFCGQLFSGIWSSKRTHHSRFTSARASRDLGGLLPHDGQRVMPKKSNRSGGEIRRSRLRGREDSVSPFWWCLRADAEQWQRRFEGSFHGRLASLGIRSGNCLWRAAPSRGARFEVPSTVISRLEDDWLSQSLNGTVNLRQNISYFNQISINNLLENRVRIKNAIKRNTCVDEMVSNKPNTSTAGDKYSPRDHKHITKGAWGWVVGPENLTLHCTKGAWPIVFVLRRVGGHFGRLISKSYVIRLWSPTQVQLGTKHMAPPGGATSTWEQTCSITEKKLKQSSMREQKNFFPSDQRNTQNWVKNKEEEKLLASKLKQGTDNWRKKPPATWHRSEEYRHSHFSRKIKLGGLDFSLREMTSDEWKVGKLNERKIFSIRNYYRKSDGSMWGFFWLRKRRAMKMPTTCNQNTRKLTKVGTGQKRIINTAR